MRNIMSANRQHVVWITLALGLYLFFSLTYLTLPGLQYDETNFANAAMGKRDALFCFWEPKIFAKKLPLMIMPYIGAVKSALYAPIFKVFGESATTVRLPVVLIGLCTLLISYALFRRMFDRKIAVISLFLFATDPTFIFGNKLD
jgi:4-amino-4-deoxy-L-arabinose transferase-like glycosyltransferase